MKTKKEENNKYELHLKDIEWLHKIATELNDIADNGSISEDTIRRLDSAAKDIESITDKMFWKIFNLLKNGIILDED